MDARDGGEEQRYVLGYTARELERLDVQGALYRDVTRRALLDAGLRAGMSVLDLGSGSGDLSLLAGELVAPGGRVVGIDRDRGTVEAAAARSRARAAEGVSFQVAQAGERVEGGPFDALVGRFVLMHQADPASVLSGALRNVRAGGVVVFVESCMSLLEGGAHSLPRSPLYDAVVRWKCAVVGGAGADLEAGLRLRRTFVAAGLPAPTTRLSAQVEGGADSPVYAYLAESVRSMLPRARAQGVEGFDEHAVDALAERLRDEVTGNEGVLVNWPVVAAWSRVPG